MLVKLQFRQRHPDVYQMQGELIGGGEHYSAHNLQVCVCFGHFLIGQCRPISDGERQWTVDIRVYYFSFIFKLSPKYKQINR